MKYIKAYEGENFFRLINKSIWFIKDINTYRKFIYEIILDYKYEKKLREIERDIDSNNFSNKDIYGIFLYYSNNENIRYIILNEEMDFNKKKDLLKKYNYVYRGEIIIKPGRVLVDTLGVDIEKYNL